MLDLRATIDDHPPLEFFGWHIILGNLPPYRGAARPEHRQRFFVLQQATFALGMAMFT